MNSFLAEVNNNSQVASPLLDASVGGILFAAAMIFGGGPQGLRRSYKDQPRGIVVVALLIGSGLCIGTAAYRIFT